MIILLLVLLAAAGLAPQPAIAGTDCFEISGNVIFQGLVVTPATPSVGDQVTLQFDVQFQVYSVTSVRVKGADPLLDGQTSHSGRDTSFQLAAVAPGMTMVQLSVTYGTEIQCMDSYGHTYFQEGPDHTVTSPAYAITIAPGALSCAGDCDGNNDVTVDELTRGVAFALGDDSVELCDALDRDHDHTLVIGELIAAVDALLFGCPPSP
jgi:hypothetical protein